MDTTLEMIAAQIVSRRTVDNARNSPLSLKFDSVVIKNPSVKGLRIVIKGELLRNGGGCLFINGHAVPMNSEVVMPLAPPIMLRLEFKVFADSSVRVDELSFCELDEAVDQTAECDTDADVLVVCPAYPSSENLYMCAFAHTRTRWYVEHGLKVQVAVIGETWYQKRYKIDGVSVFVGCYKDLKTLLTRKQYKVVITHFVDTKLYQIYDGYISTEQLVFICHGGDVRFRKMDNICRSYFTAPVAHAEVNVSYDIRERWLRKFAVKDNVEWVFVSDWLRKSAEEINGVSFRHSTVIHNFIDNRVFVYQPKSPECRKHIVIVRKFDNTRQHSLDQSVLAILSLSRRKFFSDLTFDIYGDGHYWRELTAPLRRFKNVHLHNTFVPNHSLPLIYENRGILLLPSRHDSHAVAMGEGASAGMVVVGSAVTSNPYFMNQEKNRTLADPEKPDELADIIERLYKSPSEFQEISERMSRETQERCSSAQTVMRELQLIKDKLESFSATPTFCVKKSEFPILTVVVPAYNVEVYLAKTLYTLCNHRNAGKMEVLVVNDGSQDSTSAIAREYEKYTAGVVRLIEKPNGGHGSTINRGLEAATGKYFRIIDGDDWVDSDNLALLIDYLESHNADLVLTKGRYEYADKADMVNIIDYPMLNEGTVYHFDDLLYQNYGFQTYGPLLTTGNYRTDCLKRAGFKLSEKKPYVDMEFNAFAQRYVDTVVFKDLDIYRYLIGRTGQTVSPGFWKKKHGDHRSIIFNILETLDRMSDYSEWRRVEFVYKHILAMMIDSQVFMYDQLCMWPEIDKLIGDLSKWPKALKAGLDYIGEKNGDCKLILANYRSAIRQRRSVPLTGEAAKGMPVVGSCQVGNTCAAKAAMALKMARKAVKMLTPYGAVRLYQRHPL